MSAAVAAELAGGNVHLAVRALDQRRSLDWPGWDLAVAGAASGTKEVVIVLDRVAGAVAENRSAAETVLMAAETMESAAASLSGKVESFLREVAA